MSLKPLKKSDLDKNWMKARRDKPKKIQPEYHLIVTEGTDTELAKADRDSILPGIRRIQKEPYRHVQDFIPLHGCRHCQCRKAG